MPMAIGLLFTSLALALCPVWVAAEPPAGAVRPAPSAADAPTRLPALILAAEQRLPEQDLAGAVADLERAVAAAPASAPAHLRLGGTFLPDQGYQQAVAQFQRVLSWQPSRDEAFIGMAVADLHAGRLELARAALLEARRLAPDKATR